MNKKTFYSELAYVLGMIILAFGSAMMEKADLGMSMVVAPAYLLHLRISEFLPFFSFGMAEYTLQAFLVLSVVIIVRRFKFYYLFSFVTAVLYGLLLDCSINILSYIGASGMVWQIVFYAVGLVMCSCGVALLFRTYISPEAYELFVKEFATKFKLNLYNVKTCYDCISCLVGVCLSFAFFGWWHFEGVKIGTIICALVNGRLIGVIDKAFDKYFSFKDALPLKRYF